MCKFEVKCKCGHVGKKNFIVIAFPVIASDGKEAARKARYFPRVKHDHKDAIISVRKISDLEFDELLQRNNEDEYLHCSNRQEQNQIDLSDRIQKEICIKNFESEEIKKILFFGKIEVKKPKKFFKNIIDYGYRKEEYAW